MPTKSNPHADAARKRWARTTKAQRSEHARHMASHCTESERRQAEIRGSLPVRSDD